MSSVSALGERNHDPQRAWLWSWVLVAALALVASPSAYAQGPQQGSTSTDYFTLPFNDASGSIGDITQEPRIVGGYGFKGRIGHEAGQTVGRTQSITYFDLSPYVFQDNWYFFGEGNLALGNNGRLGGNAGIGARRFLPELNTIVGANGWYTGDQTRGVLFSQWGVGGEILTEWLDFRTNFYFPYGETFKVTGQRFEPGTQKFIDVADVTGVPTDGGTYLQFQRRTFTATAMQGFDMMFTAPVPSELAQRFNLEASAGFYNFRTSQGNVPDAWGYKLRLDGDLFERLSHMFVEVLHDNVFRTNVVFGADINYWHHLEYRPRIGHSQYHRLAEWVRRNRTVVAFEGSFLNPPETAINPRTNLPYVISQVNSATGNPAGPGTLGSPFQDLQTAIDTVLQVSDAGGNRLPDIVFAQGNSVFDNTPINLDSDFIQVLGEQQNPNITIPVQGLTGGVLLPTITPLPFNAPVIQNVLGADAVTISANNTRFGAINITNTTNGNALFASGVNSFEIDEVTIQTVTNGNGAELVNNTGLFAFNNVQIFDVTDVGFHVSGGDAAILYTGNLNALGTQQAAPAAHGYTMLVENAAGSINMLAMNIQDTESQGIKITDSSTNVSFGAVTLTSPNPVPGEAAVYIFDHSGGVTFSGDLAITSASDDSFIIRQLQPTGTVTSLGTTTITGRTNHGLWIDDIVSNGTTAGSVVFQGPLIINNVTAGTDPGLLFRSNSGVASFVGNVIVNGSRGDGVEITQLTPVVGATPARFLATGAINILNVNGTAAGGAPSSISFNLHDVVDPAFQVRTQGLTVDNRGTIGSQNFFGTGIYVNNFAGSAQFLQATTVNNQNNSFATGILVDTNSGAISFNNATVDNQLGVVGGGGFAVRVVDNTDTANGVGFGTVNVTGARNVTGVSLERNGFVAVGDGSIDVTNGRGIEVLTNLQHNVNLTSVTASNSDFGILVQNSPGIFTVTGVNAGAGSGGTIRNMTAAGAGFFNTQTVRLGYMDFNNNFRGINANTLIQENIFGDQPELTLQGITVNASASEGILAVDTVFFQLLDSTITSNGVTNTQEQIELLANTSRIDTDNPPDGFTDTIVNYRYVFNNNDIEDSFTATIANTDMIFIHTAAGIEDPVLLNLFFTNNGTPPNGVTSVTSNRTGGNAALNVTWQGQFNATITGNQFDLLAGANQVGVNLNIDGIADVVFSNNSLSATGANDIGLQWLFQQRASIQISDNASVNANGNFINNSGFVMSGLNSTGISLTFLDAADRVFIERNLIQFVGNAQGSDGILFNRIVGNNGDTVVTINGNEIDLFPVFNVFNAQLQRGIFFVDVRGLITLVGNVDNIITPPTFLPLFQDFFIPANTSVGTILVNGAPVP